MGRCKKYTEEQERFLADNARMMSRKALTEFFNLRFNTCKSEQAIKVWCNRRGYNSASTGRFEKGCETWQKGLKGEEFKKHFTEESLNRSLSKMHDACKTKKIGDEIIIDGEPWIVTSLEYGIKYSLRRKPKRRVVWERLYGEIPKDHCIICLDGDPMNCEPDNLYCLPIKYRAILSRNKWYFKDAQLTLAAIKWCELHFAIKEQTK